MSKRTSPVSTPNSAPRRATWAARALAINVLVGMQPVLTHVPPTYLRSISATRMPASVRRPARNGPAWPAPMMIASRSEEHTSELQSLMRISYAVFCLKKKSNTQTQYIDQRANDDYDVT